MQIRFFIDGPNGLISFGSEHDETPLPWGLDPEGSSIAYGLYFKAISQFLFQGEKQALVDALCQHLNRGVSAREIESLEIISQKHGAFYHVAQLRVKASGQIVSFAVNCAVGTKKQTSLELEFNVLRDLGKRFPPGMIPRAYVLGESDCAAEHGGRLVLKAFVAEWFEGFHEFHLFQEFMGDSPAIRVWDVCGSDSFLDDRETLSLYHEAAAILTAYFDTESFSQIYPWHHAAGDFILKRRQGGVELRLITVRGYMPLLTVDPGASDRWVPFVHFFLNLSLRMRLDRLDGTGEMVWANPHCLHGVVSGFLEMWEKKAEKDLGLPTASQVLDVLRSLNSEEWYSLAELVLLDGLVEADEIQFIQSRLDDHVVSLCEVLKHKKDRSGP